MSETGAFPPIKELPIPTSFRVAQERLGGSQYANSLRRFQMGECTVLISRDPFGRGPLEVADLRWHISISCRDRAPSWEEIKHVQNTLKPGVFFCMPMPPKEYWFSIHEYVYHLEEVKDQAQIEHWKAQV